MIESLRERGLLVEATSIVHRYPVCWRCRTPLVFRVVDDWFISADEIRQPMLDGNATVEWTPPQYKKRMDDWLRNMGDWNISRRRYFGLPLPFYECECGKLNVIGSRAELEERAVSGLEQLEELHRPWIDAVRIRCESCDAEVERIEEVGDAWLDAGIVHFSTLGWQNPEWIPHGYATGASAGISRRRPARPRVLGEVVPGRLGLGGTLADPALVLLAVLHGRHARRAASRTAACLTYENVVDETGREMHKSWGNAIDLDDALERMGADTMRWLYCSQNPAQELRFGYGLAEEVKRRFLTFWNSVKFFVDYANIVGFRPSWPPRRPRATSRRSTAGSSSARTRSCAGEAAYERVRHGRPDAGVGLLRRRPLELVHPPLAAALLGRDDEAAFATLWYALVQPLRVLAPILPFVADHLWRTLVLDGPESVHLAGWPEVAEPDRALLDEIAEVRRVVELGRQARSSSGIKLRQPLRRLVVEGASLDGHVEEIADELRVKEVELGAVEAVQLRVKPNLPKLGPKLGRELGTVRDALAAGEFEELPTAAASGWRDTSSTRTRCSSSAAGARAGRSPPATA